MGVEKFFSTVNRNFNIIQTIEMSNNETNINASYLMFDFNSIIHTESSKLLHDLNEKNIKEKQPKLNQDQLDILIIKQVNKFIISILKKLDLNKLKLMYIALDGVPSFSKMLEQKKRRFVGDFITKLLDQYNLPFNWSKNNISPGTIFMNKITKYLSNIKSIIDKENIKDLILDLDDYDFYTKINKFEYSDSDSPGEAEMKIFDLLDDLDGPIIYFSPDSDVILLSMISKKSNDITIFKFEQQTEALSIINIKSLKQSIYIYCIDRIKKEFNIDNMINDIVFIFTTSGNDFIPRCEAIQTDKDFLFLIDLYLIILIDYGYILINNNISNIAFFKFLTLLGKHEHRLLMRNAKQNIYENYRYANQTNFYIDFIKFKSSEITSSDFYDNILMYIDPGKMDIKGKYGCLGFYLMDKKTIFATLKVNAIFPINTLFNIDISKTDHYEKLRHVQYTSKLNKHVKNMKDMNPSRKEMYLIENKLDKYTKLFNPISSFYTNILTLNKINTIFYYKKYFINIKEKEIVNKYLEGYKWVMQYYFDRKRPIDETWFYPYTRAPLLETILKYYSSIIIDTNFEPKINKITPMEQLLYITPIRLSQLNKSDFFTLFAEYKNEKFINKIKSFIGKNPHLFYNLDEIYDKIKTGELPYGLFDCSSSNFVNKCHYEILNFIVNLDLFVKTFRETTN